MSAIYQRARPIQWEQVIGQEHVKDVLRGALEAGRIGHAYLFSGPHGVGKTTTARLIAMSANCTSAGKKPCGECESCLSVRAGNHPDVLEIDAASNNSVDDVRELREKVNLSAMRGGKKIYILDEAHMMSRAAFNALLKTLEEPPEHVIFILATTEPEKILPTILSRCQHYRFRRLTAEEIAGKLASLVTQEGAKAEPDALQLIGRLADGAMRDGESLLERMLAAGQDINRLSVEAALGLPPSERVRAMAQALVGLDAGPLLAGAGQLYHDGYAARTVVEGLVSALGEALHAELGLETHGKLDGASVHRLLKLQAALDAQEARFNRGADLLNLELALTHALLAGEDTTSPGGPNQPAEAVSGLSGNEGARLAKLEREVSALRAGALAANVAAAAVIHTAAQEHPSGSASPRATPPLPTSKGAVAAQPNPANATWADVLALRETSAQLRAFLKPARMHAEVGYASLSYDVRGKFHAKQVYEKFDDVGQLVLKVFGPVTFELISPEHNRKAKLGGTLGPEAADTAAAGTAAASPGETASKARVPPASAPKAAAPLPALDDVPDFSPTRSARSAARLPAAPTPLPPDPTHAPAFEPRARPTPLRPHPTPPSPDDAAAAPLPSLQHNLQQHAADPVAEPEGRHPFAETATASRKERVLYIPTEPLSQEPDWDDLGGPLESPAQSGPDDVATGVKEVDKGAVNSNAAGRSTLARPSAAAPSASASDVRAHPNYQEVTRLFSGRVKEIGKLKTKPAPSEDEDAVDEVGGAEA